MIKIDVNTYKAMSAVSSLPVLVNVQALYVVARLSQEALETMKAYTLLGGRYSTGKLSASIRKRIYIHPNKVIGVVKPYVRYAGYVEYGVKRRTTHFAKKVFVIPARKWLTARFLTPKRSRFGKKRLRRGYFYFLKKFTHGTYVGWKYREKTYNHVVNYWNNVLSKQISGVFVKIMK